MIALDDGRELVFDGETPSYDEIPDVADVTDSLVFVSDDYLLCKCTGGRCTALHVLLRRFDDNDPMPRVAATFTIPQLEEMLLVAKIIQARKMQ